MDTSALQAIVVFSTLTLLHDGASLTVGMPSAPKCSRLEPNTKIMIAEVLRDVNTRKNSAIVSCLKVGPASHRCALLGMGESIPLVCMERWKYCITVLHNELCLVKGMLLWRIPRVLTKKFGECENTLSETNWAFEAKSRGGSGLGSRAYQDTTFPIIVLVSQRLSS